MKKANSTGSNWCQQKSTHQKKSVMAPVDCGPLGNAPIDSSELGTQTEAEKHLKDLLDKQLNTKITLEQYSEKQRQFTKSSTYTPLSELISGSHSLEEFITTEKSEEAYRELQCCGLTEEEIELYLAHNSKIDLKKQHFPMEPSILKQKIELIEEKLNKRHEDFIKPQAFKGAKALNRHEMDIEKSLYAGCSSKNQLSSLVTHNNLADSQEDHLFKHIDDMSKKLTAGLKKSKKKRKKFGCSDNPVNGQEEKDKDSSISDVLKVTEECDFEYDPNIHHVVVPLEPSEVNEQRLTVDKIKEIEKFKNYDPGNPTKVLYLKNLHAKVTLEELRSLFGSFEDDNGDLLTYKLFSTGKLKGQAFVNFQDAVVAERALHFVNGYILRKRPIIIEYGRKKI